MEAQSLANQVNGSSDTTDLRFVLKKTGKIGTQQSKPSHRQSGRIAPAPISQQSSVKDTQHPISQVNQRSVSSNDEALVNGVQPRVAGETKLNDLARNVMSKLDVALTNLERDRVQTTSGRLNNSPLLRQSTFPVYQNQNQQRRPLSTASSDSKLMNESATTTYPNDNSNAIQEVLKRPQPIEKLSKISDSSLSLSFSPSPLSLSSSPLSESSLSDIFDLQEMMFLVNNGINYLESKEKSQWDDVNPTKPKIDSVTENKQTQQKINDITSKSQISESKSLAPYSKLDELEQVQYQFVYEMMAMQAHMLILFCNT